MKNAWWYDFIPTITDEEYVDLKKQFDKLDKDKSKSIEIKIKYIFLQVIL